MKNFDKKQLRKNKHRMKRSCTESLLKNARIKAAMCEKQAVQFRTEGRGMMQEGTMRPIASFTSGRFLSELANSICRAIACHNFVLLELKRINTHQGTQPIRERSPSGNLTDLAHQETIRIVGCWLMAVGYLFRGVGCWLIVVG